MHVFFFFYLFWFSARSCEKRSDRKYNHPFQSMILRNFVKGLNPGCSSLGSKDAALEYCPVFPEGWSTSAGAQGLEPALETRANTRQLEIFPWWYEEMKGGRICRCSCWSTFLSRAKNGGERILLAHAYVQSVHPLCQNWWMCETLVQHSRTNKSNSSHPRKSTLLLVFLFACSSCISHKKKSSDWHFFF